VVRGYLSPDSQSSIVLKPYNDLLPTPSRIEIDPEVAPVRLTASLIGSFTGDGFPQSLFPGALPFPNRIFLKLSLLGNYAFPVQIILTGTPYPSASALDFKPEISETVSPSEEGWSVSLKTWSALSSILVRNLPPGSVLETHCLRLGSVSDFTSEPAGDTLSVPIFIPYTGIGYFPGPSR